MRSVIGPMTAADVLRRVAVVAIGVMVVVVLLPGAVFADGPTFMQSEPVAPGARLRGMAGTIDVQTGSVDANITLGEGSLSLNWSLTGAGPQGQAALVVPSQFGLSLATSSGNVDAFGVCGVVGPQAVNVSGERGSGLHVDFRNAENDATPCAASSPSAAELIMAPLTFAAQTAPPDETSAVASLGSNALQRFIVLVIVSGLVFLFAPRVHPALDVAARARPWSRLGLGLGVLVILPVLGVCTFIVGLSLGLWWLGVLLLMLFASVLAVSVALSGLVLGAWLLDRVHDRRLPRVLAFGVGLLVVTVLGLLPGIGWLVNLVAVVYGAGVLLMLPRAGRTQTEEAVAPAAAPVVDGVPAVVDGVPAG